MSDTDADILHDLVDANHILYHHGVVDGFGHVSARNPANPASFLIARSMAPVLVTAADIVELDFNGNPLIVGSPASYLERFIHGEIYRARPDVFSVVHSHALGLIPVGLVPGASLRAISHMGGFIGASAPVFEIRDDGGQATDMLVRTPQLGAALARRLGAHTIVLMRGHGSTIVGFSIRQAVYRAIYAESNARLQSEALRLGNPTYLTPEEAEAAARTNDASLDRAWTSWLHALRG